MSEDFTTAQDGMGTQAGFPRFAYSVLYSDGPEESISAYMFAEPAPPVETDLLPDEEIPTRAYEPKLTNLFAYDVAVIGGGPTGVCAAVRAAGLGAKVILFEKDALGGACLNSGGLPFGIYHEAAETLRRFREAESQGLIRAHDIAPDMRGLLARKDALVAKRASNIARLLRANAVRVESGAAALKSANEVVCLGKVYTAAKIILCSGSVPEFPPVRGLSHPGVLASGGLLNLGDAPRRLLVFGGGAEGVEMASIFAAFGSGVMLACEESRILADFDAQVSEAVGGALVSMGVKIYAGVSVEEIKDKDGSPFVVTGRGGVLCDKVAVCFGQKPDLGCLGALAGSLGLRAGGALVDEFLQTNVPGIFAAGGATGFLGYSSAEQRMAETAAENALGAGKAFVRSSVPSVVRALPEAASFGLTEEKAREVYADSLGVGVCPIAENPRAACAGTSEGFVKVLVDREYGEIVGTHIVASGASEMIAEPAALMRMEATVSEALYDVVRVGGTYSEAFASACAEAATGAVRP